MRDPEEVLEAVSEADAALSGMGLALRPCEGVPESLGEALAVADCDAEPGLGSWLGVGADERVAEGVGAPDRDLEGVLVALRACEVDCDGVTGPLAVLVCEGVEAAVDVSVPEAVPERNGVRVELVLHVAASLPLPVALTVPVLLGVREPELL